MPEATVQEQSPVNAKQPATSGKQWVVTIGLGLALIGAVLIFALEDRSASLLGVSLQPFGGVLFATGVLLAGGCAIGTLHHAGAGNSPSATGEGGIKAIGGLIAVVAGITAVAVLAVVTLTRLPSADKSSMVAISSSAFGVISAVLGAYLGIKVTSDHAASVTAEAKDAAVSQHQAEVDRQKLVAMTDKVEEVAPEKADEVKAAGFKAGEEASRTTRPGRGGRHT
jgi:hypothetical protein